MFSFEEIKEVLDKHSYKELIEDYRLRQRYNSFKNDEITEDVITLLPISSYLLPFDIHDSLSLYIAGLRFRNDFKKLEIINEILDKYHYNYTQELLVLSQYIDQLQTGDYSIELFNYLAKGLLSIESITQIENDFLLDTNYGRIKITNQITDVEKSERRGLCHDVTSDFLNQTDDNYYGAYYYVPLAFKGYIEHSVVIDSDNNLVLDLANNNKIDYSVWNKLYPNCSFIISSKDFNKLNNQMLDYYDIPLQTAILEEVRRIRK